METARWESSEGRLGGDSFSGGGLPWALIPYSKYLVLVVGIFEKAGFQW